VIREELHGQPTLAYRAEIAARAINQDLDANPYPEGSQHVARHGSDGAARHHHGQRR
jgi:hypothetical protein